MDDPSYNKPFPWGEGPQHPVFGRLEGFSGHWHFQVPLNTEGVNTSEVQFYMETKPNAAHVQNYKELKEKWSTLWPLIFKELKMVLDDYGYTENLTLCTPKLSLSLPETLIAEGAEWSVLLEFEPFGGIFDVELRGWSEVADKGATF